MLIAGALQARVGRGVATHGIAPRRSGAIAAAQPRTVLGPSRRCRLAATTSRERASIDADRADAQHPGRRAGAVDDRAGAPSRRAGRRPGRPPRASPSWSTASCAVVAAGRPERLALETASGPVRRSRSRATSSSGSRTATVPSASPRSQARDGACSTHQGEPARPERLGQVVRRPAAGSTTRPASVEASPISTGTGMSRPRFLAASSPVDRRRGERVGGDAVDGVGGQQRPARPRPIAAAAASRPAARCVGVGAVEERQPRAQRVVPHCAAQPARGRW